MSAEVNNRNARNLLKTRIQTESTGFFNGLLMLPAGHAKEE